MDTTFLFANIIQTVRSFRGKTDVRGVCRKLKIFLRGTFGSDDQPFNREIVPVLKRPFKRPRPWLPPRR